MRNNYNNNDVSPNQNDLSPCSYNTRLNFPNNEFFLYRRTYSYTSSVNTPDASVRFGLRDFNPDDFKYEYLNIRRVSEHTKAADSSQKNLKSSFNRNYTKYSLP